MKPLLTICILSYNRAEQLDALLLYLRRSLLPRYAGGIELLVVNNCSTDSTAQVLARHEREGLRVVHRELFLPTAEENMMASLEYCTGEYTWFLGDDDYPNIDAFDGLMRHLRGGGVDLFVSNTASISENGLLLRDSIVPLECASLDLTTDELVAATGILALLAGISRLVLRTARARTVDGRLYLAIQTVYAHVFWLLAAFRDAQIRVLGMPLLKYTTLAPDADLRRFLKLQRRTGVGRYTYWGFGLARLVAFALDEQVLSADVLARAFDLNNDGSHSRLLDSLVLYGYKQVLEHFQHGGVEAVTPNDYATWRDLVLSLDPAYLPMVRRIDTLYLQAASNGGVRFGRRIRALRLGRDFIALWEALLHENRIHSVLYRGSVHGFDVYRGPRGWVAFKRHETPWPVETVLRLDIAMLCGSSLQAHTDRDELLRIIEREPGGLTLAAEGRIRQHRNAALWAESLGAHTRHIEGALYTLNKTLAEAMFIVRLPYLLGVRLPRRVWRSARRVLGAVLRRS